MEEHRRGGAKPKHRLTPSGQRPGKILLDLPPLRAFVANGASGIGAVVVKALCDAGCRVAFCDADTKAGAATAQRCGAQYHPADPADASALSASLKRVADSWGAVEMAIIAGAPLPEPSTGAIEDACGRILAVYTGDAPASLPSTGANVIVVPDGIDDKTLTTMVIIMSTPAAANIRSQIFRL